MSDPFGLYAGNMPSINIGGFGIGSLTDAQIAELAKNNMLPIQNKTASQHHSKAGLKQPTNVLSNQVNPQSGADQNTVEETPPVLTDGILALSPNAQTLFGVKTPLYQGGPIPEFRYLDTSREDYAEEMRRQQDALRKIAGNVEARTPTNLASAMQQARDEYADYGVDTFARGGLATLSSQDMADNLARMGRYDDDQIAHVAEGEVIVPAPIMKYYPEVKDKVFEAIREEGLDPEEFIVGGDMVARNPRTGVQEFGFFSKVFKKIKKVVKKFAPIIMTLAIPGIGAALGASSSLLGFGSIKAAALTGGLGSLTGSLIQGKGLKDSLKAGAKGALISGAVAGVAGKPLSAKAAAGPTPLTVEAPTIEGVAPSDIETIAGQTTTVGSPIPKTSVPGFESGVQLDSVEPGVFSDPLPSVDTLSTTLPSVPSPPPSTISGVDISVDQVVRPLEGPVADLSSETLYTQVPSPVQSTPTLTGSPLTAPTTQFSASGLSAPTTGGLQTAINQATSLTVPSGIAGLQAIPEGVASEAAKKGFFSNIVSGAESLSQDPGQFLQDTGSNYLANLQAKPLSTLTNTAGVASLGAGLLSMEEEQDQTPLDSPFDDPLYQLTSPGQQYFDITDPRYQALLAQQQQGIQQLVAAREGGEIVGPGTGTSDSIPALLSDGEFVMTAKAVKGAGNGDRRLGAAKMYDMMSKLESNAA